MGTILISLYEEAFSQAVARLLEAKGHIALKARDGPHLMRLAQEVSAAYIILDLVMPGASGLETLGLLRQDPLLNPIPILMMVPQGWSPDDPHPAFSFMAKPVNVEELVDQVHQSLSASSSPWHYNYQSPLELDSVTFSVWLEGQQVALSPTEFKLLSYLLKRKGEIIPIRKLLNELWAKDEGEGNSQLVRVHIRNIRKKLGRASDKGIGIIKVVPRQGYTVI